MTTSPQTTQTAREILAEHYDGIVLDLALKLRAEGEPTSLLIARGPAWIFDEYRHRHGEVRSIFTAPIVAEPRRPRAAVLVRVRAPRRTGIVGRRRPACRPARRATARAGPDDGPGSPSDIAGAVA